MKALVIGLGSMGKRRVRNLQALGVSDIHGYERDTETARKAAEEYGITLLASLEGLAEAEFGLVVISTPPGAHLEYAKRAIDAGIPFFTELNLHTKESKAIAKLAHTHKVLWLPSDTELFDADIEEIVKEVGDDWNGYFTFHLGQNINDWHPWQEPGEHFIFKPATNGIREMLRVELPWMLEHFGPVRSVAARAERFATARYGIDDYMAIELAFVRGARASLVFDLISPEVVKRLELVSPDKHVIWHERENTLETFTKGEGKKTRDLRSKEIAAGYAFGEDAHLAEMSHVLEVMAGKTESKLLPVREEEVLRLIDRIEKLAH